MAESIDLRSTAFLEQARDILRRTHWQLGNHADVARDLVRQARQRLEQEGQARIDELRDAQRALEAVDEDESDWHERDRRDQAYEAVQQFRRVASDVDDAGRRFVARASSLSDRGQKLTQAGIASLDRRIEALAEYR